MNRQRILPLCLLLLLGGCAGQAIQYQDFDRDYWQADGKMGIKYPRCDQYRGCESRAINATYLWTHGDQSNYLQFFDPTGQEQLALDYYDGEVIIQEKGREEIVSVAELATRLGIDLPVEQLPQWLTNQRADGDTEWDSDGWHIRVGDWQGQFYRAMTLTRGDYRLRMVTYNVTPI